MSNVDFKNKIKELTKHHRNACKAYDDIYNGVSGIWEKEESGPFLPVSIFKELDLRSVSVDQVKRQLTSSGTTGQKVSKIYLDAETAANQQRVLCEIVSEYIGEKRIPMLIIDSPDVLRDRTKYSARGAGIMGFSMMASKRFYALDNEMKIDLEQIRAFAEAAEGGPCFAFGFTYMIWQYFYGGLRDSAFVEGRSSEIPDLSNCYLIHGGGWKKLADQAVSNEEFKAGLKRVCGIEKVSDYYGMAEQTGSIFMECECGHLHASDYSDIVCIDPSDFSELGFGEEGLLALTSTLPRSYPGHRLLTEDWGCVLGEDDCPCGRPGKYFEIKGRIKKAEIRGCSDTFEGARPAVNRAEATASETAESTVSETAEAKASETGTTRASGVDSNMTLLAGNWPAEIKTRGIFDGHVLDYLDALSKLFIKEPEYRSVPEIYALGFWCRRAHMQRLQTRQIKRESIGFAEGGSRKGRGLILHITPSNMPTMFAYSWITSLLAGNSNVIRMSSRESEISSMILGGIKSVLERPEFRDLSADNCFVQFPRDDAALEKISMMAAGRVIWGGDETVRNICEIPKADGCIDITFPDKYSIAVLDANGIISLSDEEIRLMIHLFYNDTYGADQNACSSPRTVFWVDNGSTSNGASYGIESAKKRWWDALSKEAERYDLQPWMATEKYRNLCCAYANHKGLVPVRNWGNKLYVVPCEEIDPPLWNYEAKLGMFFEYVVESVEDIKPLLDSKIQTAVTNIEGLDLDVDRIVSIGEALDFDTVWDRKDLIEMLSES